MYVVLLPLCVNTTAVDKYIVPYITILETELALSTVVKCYMETVTSKLSNFTNSRLAMLLASLSHVFIVGSNAG